MMQPTSPTLLPTYFAIRLCAGRQTGLGHWPSWGCEHRKGPQRSHRRL